MTHFELAQGSHQKIRTLWETNRKAGIKENTDLISIKELNPSMIEKKRMRAKKDLSVYKELQ